MTIRISVKLALVKLNISTKNANIHEFGIPKVHVVIIAIFAATVT